MDVLSLEHYFGKEVETSLRQMFNYFCNHINLGQWTAAKACLIQLESNKKNIDFDYSSVRTEIMKNPELYNYGSCSLESPYHLSLLLYEFCVQNGFMENRGELFYDKMLFKFLMYSSLIEINNKESSNGQNHQPIIDELIKIIWPNEGQSNADATDKEEESSEFSRSTNEFFKQLFIIQPKKAISMIELINRYNKNIRYNILKVHLDAIYSLLEQIESANLSYHARQETKSSIFGLINLLSAYELKENSNTAENNYYESLALVQRCFKEICFRFNAIWAHNLDELEETFYQLYSRLLFDFEESSSSNEESTTANESINIAYLFSKIHYEVEKQITIIETFQDESLTVLSIIKRYTSSARKDFLWRRLFLFCYCENKLLLKTLIDECLLVISRGQLEHLNLLFGVKEFLNLKPLILLLGISKANDVQSAKKLLAMMCLNHEKGTLCEKIGNILKTHLDFIAWFQQVNEGARKKEISFAELIKLLHRQLPLNIISQHIDLAQTDPAEITKVLRNTLMDKQSGSKTKWVRFVDEVNEKILQIQETCLAIYNGFYCLNEVLNTILYTCEHLNSKIYSNLRPISLAASKKSTVAVNLDDTTVGQSQTKQQAKLERVQSEYTKNVVQKLDLVKKTLNQIVPVQFRIEIIENMYSLLFLSSNDLKESEDEEEEDEEEEGVTKIGNDASDEEEMEPREKAPNQATRTISKEAESGGGLESFEILSEEWVGANNANSGLPKLKVNDDREYSIYDLASPNSVVRQESRTSNQMTNHSSKSTLGSYSSYASNESQRYYRKYSSGHAAGNNSVGTNEDDNYFTSRKTKSNIYRRNAGGGGSFLVNDFLCRDLLLLLKEAVQIPQPQQQQQQQQLQPHLNDSTSTRLSKIQKLINETFWRFQVIKPDQILLDYGRISNLASSANNSSPDSPSLVNDTHHIIIYDIIKKRKRSGSSGSSHPFVESLNISTTKSNQSKATEQQPISLALNKMRTLTGGTVPTTDMSIKRRSVESQRSLSLIYPINRYKRSNQTIMKLLSDVPTLAVICLKEKKFADADQLLKMYSSASLPSLSLNDVAQNNRFSANFELDQIEFHSAYENSLKELRRIEETRSSQMKQNNSSLIEDSLLSLEILKSIQPILDVAKDDNLLQSIVLCDTAASSNFGLNISLALVEHSKVYLNSIQASQTGGDEANKNATESDELKDSSGMQKEIEINKFKSEMRDRLDRFDSSVKEICHHFIEQHQQQQVKRMNEYLYTLDGICISLGEVSKEGIDHPHHHHDKQLRSSPNKLFKNIHVSIEKYESFAQLKKLLNDAKSNFELAQSRSFEATVESDIYFSIMSLLNECIRLNDNEDLISSFLYKSTKSATDHHHDSASDRFSASLRTESLSLYGSQNSLVTSLGKTASSNYLLSFYEYCKTLYEYFREKSGPATLKTVENASCFSILNYSPASLICKLLFVDGIKPVLIESLTQKLNLNLTAIILHNSCPRLKLTLGVSSAAAAQFRAASFLLIPQLSHQSNRSEPGKELKSSTAYMKQISTTSNGAERKLTILNTNQSCPSDAEIYNLGEFYLVLNQSEVTCCSRKKPDEFVRDLLLKVLKFCKSFLSRTKSNEENSAANVINSGSDAKSAQNSGHQHFVDVKTAQEIYQCAEFKAILNESQELQHLNLYLLKTDAQKLSFFINLHNLLCIHAYFFLASLNSSSKYSEKKKSRKNNLPNRNLILNEPNENSAILNESNEYIFKNKTEELLFRQKASYRVGQMGYVSLYDLKYHILNRRCLDNDTVPASINSSKSLSSPLSPVPAARQQQAAAATTKSASLLNRIGGGLAKATGGNNTPSSQKTAQQQFSGSSFKSTSQDLNLNSSFDCKKLYKSAFYAIDLNAEPLWTPFMPSERILDYHILFALINCVESDPPICVYNSDDMLADQLEMQMRLFLTDSIYADLCDDILYIPSLLIENCSWFIQSPNSPSSESNVSSNTKLLHQSSTISNSNETTITLSTSPPQSTSPSTSNVQRSDMESLVWFLKDHVSQELKDGLKCLLDLDSIDAFGENIDEFGRKELPFPVVMIAASSRFSLIIDYEYSAQPVYEMTKNFAATNSDVVSAGEAFNCLWFKKEICKTVILYEQKKLMARRSLGTVSATNLEATKESNAEESGVQSGSDESQSNNQEDSSNSSEKESPNKNEAAENKSSQSQLNSDCLEYIQKNSILISNSLSFLFDVNKRDTFFKSLSDLSGNEDAAAMSNNPLNRFIQLYVPLEYMKQMGVESKLNMITQFLLTNKTDESKIEMIIDLANYYSQKQEWRVVLDLLNACMHDSEDLMSDFTLRPAAEFLSFPASDNLKEFGVNKHFSFTDASNSKLSQRDLYNLFDHSCVCLANSEAKKNEKSYTYLFKMKNFLRQVRAIFGLMHLWPIDGCLEMIEYCIAKARLVEYPTSTNANINNTTTTAEPPNATTNPQQVKKQISVTNGDSWLSSNMACSNSDITIANRLSSTDYLEQMVEMHRNLTMILTNKKNELMAYKELTRCARITLEKYYEHQQFQDAAGFYKSDNQGPSSTNMNKMKKVCQKCLTWQFAKNQLESSSSSDDEETNELIMDLFLMNDQFTSAKYLIRKLNLPQKLQFKLDMGHLKHRLLNLNAASSIIVIDLEFILKECIAFGADGDNKSAALTDSSYVFNICFKLLNEFKDLNELNNQVLISLCEFLLTNYREMLSSQQTKELKILEETARTFQILVQHESLLPFEAYKRHHSQPELIIEQLLMNSHIELASRVLKILRDGLNDADFSIRINEMLVKYARKALELKGLCRQEAVAIGQKQQTGGESGFDGTSKRLSLAIPTSSSSQKFSAAAQKARKQSHPMMEQFSGNASLSPNINIIASSSPSSSVSSSFKNFYRFGAPSSSSAIQPNLASLQLSPNSSSMNMAGGNTSMSSSLGSSFVMPAQVPSKEEWVRDDEVNECMVCGVVKFSLLNRRHHCRRCGRVVCAGCSQKLTLIDNVSRRTCDDCFRQIEAQKINEQVRLLDTLNESLDETSSLSGGMLGSFRRRTKIHRSPKTKVDDVGSINDETANTTAGGAVESSVYWQLMGGSVDNELSLKRDEEIRQSFRYQQSPSTSLCLSILDLHDNALECGKHLLSMCDDLSAYLQTANSQVEDVGLIINMCKYLLHNAKVKLLQNLSTSSIISLCDSYLSLVDVVEQLLMANCSNIPSLNELRNTESARRVRNRLLEEERHELAMNLSTKCGLDTQTVWASWGMIELRRGQYKEARTKFDKCLKQQAADKANVSIGSTQLKILNDIIACLENTPPIRMLGPQTLLAPLRSVESLIAEPKLFSIGESNLDEIQLKESIYYLETYGNYNLIVAFYQRHGYLENALQYLLDKKCSAEVFTESVLVASIRNGEFYRLLEYMLSLERYQYKLHSYYAAIGKYLEKNSYLNTLYDFQILMKDYVRACMSCICFFLRNCNNYSELYENVHYLNKASKHLEQYLEVSSTKQTTQPNVQTQFAWKLKSDQQNLCKQISTPEVDNYLKAIKLQIEVTKFINNCIQNKKDQINSYKTPTLFGNNDAKIKLCCLILLSGQSIQEGFGFVVRIKQCFNLNPTLVYSEIARELAKQYNFKEIHNLLKCINESGYKEEINASYDECISTCIRVFAASTTQPSAANLSQQQQQQLAAQNKEIEELIQLIKDDENKINAYILNGRLKSAYLIAIKIDRADIVKHISNVAERMGQNLIKDICVKWLEKKANTK